MAWGVALSQFRAASEKGFSKALGQHLVGSDELRPCVVDNRIDPVPHVPPVRDNPDPISERQPHSISVGFRHVHSSQTALDVHPGD